MLPHTRWDLRSRLASLKLRSAGSARPHLLLKETERNACYLRNIDGSDSVQVGLLLSPPNLRTSREIDAISAGDAAPKHP